MNDGDLLPPKLILQDRRVKFAVSFGMLIFAISIIIARDPTAVTRAQFYAEDGAVWYADAYNLGGLKALFIPNAAYLQVLPRLAALLALFVPLSAAPLLLNICGIVVQSLPAVFIVSARFAKLGNLWTRITLACIYLLLPNSREVNVVVTSAQFHLALLSFLVICASPPTKLGWRVFDVLVVALSALSGPFSIVLLPLLCVYWFVRREPWTLWLGGVLIPLVGLQLYQVVTGFGTRVPGDLGATPMWFLRLLSGQVYVACVFGQNRFALDAPPELVVFAALLGSAVVAFTCWHASIELRLLLAFALLLFCAGLAKPMISGLVPQWQMLANDPGARYWFFPTLAFAWSLVWCVLQKRSAFFRVVAAGALLVMIFFGITSDFRYPSYTDTHFERALVRYGQWPVGQTIDIPIYPPGLSMYLKKKSKPRD